MNLLESTRLALVGLIANKLRAFLTMLLQHNLVHADLHPGNILARLDGETAAGDEKAGGGDGGGGGGVEGTPPFAGLDPLAVCQLNEGEQVRGGATAQAAEAAPQPPRASTSKTRCARSGGRLSRSRGRRDGEAGSRASFVAPSLTDRATVFAERLRSDSGGWGEPTASARLRFRGTSSGGLPRDGVFAFPARFRAAVAAFPWTNDADGGGDGRSARIGKTH